MGFIDITGKRFGKYTVIHRMANNKNGMAMWLCKCDCGNEKVVMGSSLRRGLIVSCRME